MAAEPRRILVTGSRDWTDRLAVYRALVYYIAQHADMGYDGQGHPVDWLTTGWVIVHGDCPTGADAIADDFATINWIRTERHPADWDRYGKRAGPIRNAEMVALGADVCLAFIGPCRRCPGRWVHGSHGATHCAQFAEQAGIPTRRLERL